MKNSVVERLLVVEYMAKNFVPDGTFANFDFE
jgi:hypothetical protein